MNRILSCLALAVVQFVASAWAENWPGWRGPRGDGTSLESGLPMQWDGTTGKNIRWKVPLPGKGHASPIVWEDRIFLVTCIESDESQIHDRTLLCFDKRTGNRLWKRSVLKSLAETKHKLNSYASSTPVTDGHAVYVTFLEVDGRTIDARNVGTPRPVTPGNLVVAAYDFAGNQKWVVRPGEFVSVHGYCSCPVLYKDLLIINGDHDGDGYIVALDRNTGSVVWRTGRDHNTRSYVTPLIRKVDGRDQMVLSGSHSVCSYDPNNGERLWKIDGPTEQFVASMVFDGRQFYMAAGFPTYHVMGIRPDGVGNVTDSHVAWHVTNARCYVPSPVVVDNYLFVADDRGTANCFDTSTGERIWRGRLGSHFSASLVLLQDHVMFLADDGKASILRPGPEPEVLFENRLGETCYASPAVSDGLILIRGTKHLFCIGTAEAN